MTDLPPDEVHDELAATETTSDAEVDIPDRPLEADDVLADTDAEIAARSLTLPETGHPAVDEVLRSLTTLEERPVDEHVAVFENAHDELRRTLSGAGDDQA